MTKAKIQYLGTGRRKCSVARVRLLPGTGNVTINKKSLDDYFEAELLKQEVMRPFSVANCEGKSNSKTVVFPFSLAILLGFIPRSRQPRRLLLLRCWSDHYGSSRENPSGLCAYSSAN